MSPMMPSRDSASYTARTGRSNTSDSWLPCDGASNGVKIFTSSLSSLCSSAAR